MRDLVLLKALKANQDDNMNGIKYITREMKITFDDLISYCFNEELPLEKKIAVERQLITDEDFFDTISGINKVKRQLRTKEAVEHFFECSKTQVHKELLAHKH